MFCINELYFSYMFVNHLSQFRSFLMSLRVFNFLILLLILLFNAIVIKMKCLKNLFLIERSETRTDKFDNWVSWDTIDLKNLLKVSYSTQEMNCLIWTMNIKSSTLLLMLSLMLILSDKNSISSLRIWITESTMFWDVIELNKVDEMLNLI